LLPEQLDSEREKENPAVMVDNSWNKETDYFGKSGTLPQKTVQGLFKDILYWDPKNDRRKD